MHKNIVIFSLLSTALIANSIEKDFVTQVAQTTLMGSQKSFESGSHDLKEGEKMSTLFVGFRYNFDSINDINFYVNAAAGLAKYENNQPMLGVLGDLAVIKNSNLELGAGVRYKIDSNSYIGVGGGVIYSQVDSRFDINSLVADTNRDVIDALYNTQQERDSYTYQVNIKYDYETTVKGYEPYLSAFLGHYRSDVDGIDETSSSTLAHLKVGIYSPELIKIANYPFKVELYAQETLLFGDIEQNMDMSNFTKIGSAFHLYANKSVKYIDNVYLDINYVTGDNIEGVHIGVSASF